MKKKKHIVVIGAGIAGLCFAALASRKGHRVTIVEAHPTNVGGLAGTVSFGSSQSTFGPRYLWDFGEGEFGRELFKRLGLDQKVVMTRLDREGFDHIILNEGDEPFLVPQSLDAFVEKLCESYPEEAQGIRSFFDLCRKSYRVSRFSSEEGLVFVGWLERIKKLFKKFRFDVAAYWYFFSLVKKSAADIMDRVGLSNELQRLLTAHGLIFAEQPSFLSFHAYSSATINYTRGSYFPKGGMQTIIDALVDIIHQNGGEIKNSFEVIGAAFSKGSLAEVKASSGETLGGDLFVSTMDPKRLYQIINQSGSSIHSGYQKFHHSGSLSALFLEVKMHEELAKVFGKWNVWIAEPSDASTRADTCNFPIYVNSPSLSYMKDSQLQEGQSVTVTAFYGVRYFDRESASVRERNDNEHFYTAEQAISMIDRYLGTRIEQNIVTHRLYSPDEISKEFFVTGGAVYGKAFTCDDLLRKIPLESGIRNLFQAGQYTSFAGIIPTLQSSTFLVNILEKRKEI